MAYTSKLDSPLPWYSWCPADLRCDRRFNKLGWGEKGLVRELIDDCYLNRTIPADLVGIAKFLDVDPSEIRDLLPRVMPWFEPAGEGLLQCPLIEKIRANQDEGRLRQSLRRSSKGSFDPGSSTVNHGNGGEKRTGEKKDQKKREKSSSTCTESDSPTPDHDDAPLSLFCGGEEGNVWPITNETWQGWKALFPELDLMKEVKRMDGWLRSHLTSKKSSKSMDGFAYDWFVRSRDRPWASREAATELPKSTSRTPDLDADYLEQFKRSQEVEDDGHAL